MDNRELSDAFLDLSTPLLADACVRLGLPLRLAPSGLRSLIAGRRLAGRALPARHYGSVDVFLEAMEGATPGDVLVIDNGGRMDEGCVGDLTALEAGIAGVAGLVVWGCHRDTPELIPIGLPVFSLGACPAGPTRLDPRADGALRSARVGPCEVTRGDRVFADDDGVLFVAAEPLAKVLPAARSIRETERRQAAAVRAGRSLRDQLEFRSYLDRRAADPGYTFRKHLRALGGAIEE